MDIRQSNCLLITCEHGGNEVPVELSDHFASAEAKKYLQSHRGYDPGALAFAEQIATEFHAPLHRSTTSRLVVDLNRSLDSPQLFSKFVAGQDLETRKHILDTYYDPYRRRVTETIQRLVDSKQSVLHLSIHSFTPKLRGSIRNFDVGVLFDPGRSWESRFSMALIEHLAQDGLRTLPNQPYLGTDDGLTTTMRTIFSDSSYAGIELELNNRISKRSQKLQANWLTAIVSAIRSANQVSTDIHQQHGKG